MPTTNQLRLPPILDEDLFEDFCRDLWADIWNDPDAQRNGRRGQTQCGVDVFGLPAPGTRHEGVQAKAYGRPLTAAELRHEVDEAKKFTPALRKLVIACTGPRDAAGQTCVRQINVDHKAAKLFSVSLLGWEDIKNLVQTYWTGKRPDLVLKYFELTTTSGALKDGIVGAVEDAVANSVARSLSGVATIDVLPSLAIQEHYHSELNFARNLINTAKPEQALDYLTSCRDRIWHDAKPSVRYRILHYQGCANFMLEHIPEAGHLLVEALQYNRDDETALSFAALGYLLLDDAVNAANSARQALRLNPGNAKAYATLIRALDPSLPFEAALEAVPEPYRKLPEPAMAIATLARQKGMLAEAETWCRLAIEQDRENWADPYGVLGELLMQQALADGPILAGFRTSPMRRGQLEGAVEAFTQAWDRVSETGIKRGRVSWLFNRAGARLILGMPREAAEDLDAAILLDADPMLALRRASIALQEGEVAQTVVILQRVRIPADQVEPCLLLAELYLEAQRHDEAEGVLDRLTPDGLSEADALSVQRLRLRIEIRREDWPGAQERYARMRSAHPDSLDVMTDGSWFWRLAGDAQASRALLAEATRQLTADGTPSQRHTLAAEWYEHGEYREAARLYDGVADRDLDNDLTRRLLVCYYNGGDLSKALELALHMLSLHGPLPTVSPIAAAVLDEAGDLPAARRVADEYLAHFPSDFEMQIRLAAILQRQGDAAGVDRFLDAPIALGTLPIGMALRVAALHAYRGRMGQALDAAYEVRRKHMDESEAHLFYTSLFFNATTAEKEESAVSAPVGVDCAVCIRDEGGRETWHVIDERDDHKMPLELAPGHPLARKLMGLVAGQPLVTRDSGFSTETATVSAVMSKYAYAMRESMDIYEHMFPDEPALWNIRLRTPEGASDGEDLDIEPFLQLIDRQHERFLNVERLYRQGEIPLAMAAQLLGKDILQTWHIAAAKPEFGIRCCVGAVGELEAAKGLLQAVPSLVLEPVALLTLYGSEVRDILTQRFGKFAVPRSLIDMIQRARQDHTGIMSKGSATLGKEGDQFVYEEIAPQRVESIVAYLDSLLAWIDANCVVVPIGSALGESRDFRARFKGMMAACFVDCILIAGEQGRTFYCEDERLRALAKSEVNADGVWSQVLLTTALDENLIGKDAYCGEVVRLLSTNYRHIFVNPGLFMVAARNAGWRPSPAFSAVTGTLSGDKCSLESAIRVATDAIYGIWIEPLMDHQRSFLVTGILDGLSAGRRRETVIAALVPLMEHRFYLLPFHYQDVSQLIAAWSRAHIL